MERDCIRLQMFKVISQFLAIRKKQAKNLSVFEVVRASPLERDCISKQGVKQLDGSVWREAFDRTTKKGNMEHK